MEPFKDSDVPVLIISSQVDEMMFNQIGQFKGLTFVNVESGYEEILKDIGDQTNKNLYQDKKTLPEDEVTPFCLWLKE